jgi:hypothetical protein
MNNLPMNLRILLLILFKLGVVPVNGQNIKTLGYKNVQVESELKTRLIMSYTRLTDSVYSANKLFAKVNGTSSPQWPGDVEGRLILGLTLEAQARHSESSQLKEIINLLPNHLNLIGYFGPVQKDTVTEQQLSGNGWYLRGLCEYYLWKKDPKIKKYISNVINNLALPTLGYHTVYPIDPNSRKKNVGAASGTTQAAIGLWKLSSDIGCDFIFLDGLVQAYGIVPSCQLKALIDEMVNRFLQIDLVSIKAQTHATLTGLRAIIRYYEITKKPNLLTEVIKRYSLYRENAMTANYENFNWFTRPEWSEPCAIIDSYLLAVQLWQYTQQPQYLEDAQHIYFNAIANTQRANGGFGLNNCGIPGRNSLNVNIDEAWWCCTMRGAEGLAKAVQYSYFTDSETLIIPTYASSTLRAKINHHVYEVNQHSEYPFDSTATFTFKTDAAPAAIKLKLFAPSWTLSHSITIDGKSVAYKLDRGFLAFSAEVHDGTQITLKFKMKTGLDKMINKTYSKPNYFTIYYGPLLLGLDTRSVPEVSFLKTPEIYRKDYSTWGIVGSGYRLSPVYHLLDPKVSKASGYSKQILFRINASGQ